MERLESQQSQVEVPIVRGRANALELQRKGIDPIIIEHESGETLVLTKQKDIRDRIDSSNKWLSGVTTEDMYGYTETTFTLSAEEVCKILNTPITLH